MIHVSESARTSQQALLAQGKQLLAEIVAIDEMIGGLAMTPQRFREKRHAELIEKRKLKVAEYQRAKQIFMARKASSISSQSSQ